MSFLWFAVGLIVGVVPLMIITVVLVLKKSKQVQSFDSENISELIGKIQHVTSVNVDTLERKVTEVKMAIRDANVVYMKLNEAISDAKNVLTLPTSQRVFNHPSRLTKTEVPLEPKADFPKEQMEVMEEDRTDSLTRLVNETAETEVPLINQEKQEKNREDEQLDVKVKTLSKEEKIFELKKRGWSVDRIAESLNMGVGEVSLIIEIGSYFSK